MSGEKEMYLGYTTDKAITPFFKQFIEALEKEHIMKSVCPKCKKEFLPPRQYCQKDMTECQLVEFTEREAKLVSFTVVEFAPETMSSRSPYVVAIGEFPSGRRLTAHITNLMDMPQVGMKLKLSFERVSDKQVTYKWQV